MIVFLEARQLVSRGGDITASSERLCEALLVFSFDQRQQPIGRGLCTYDDDRMTRMSRRNIDGSQQCHLDTSLYSAVSVHAE